MNSQINESNSDTKDHQVVARKYRPQSFELLIGQEPIATALGNAIETNRVGHAYLFTGARGVGKTTSARIFAKCLNCEKGPTPTPCNQCEICKGITSGDDLDVLEIDGASNRGIDEIRALRSNATIRPSRARFKIYIIDEVHMLTREAFNALLKTLEEPPKHVKFIFCTTDPHKIPITVLSRCQRFDFAPVQTSQIAQSLASIVQGEKRQAEPEALMLLARRANGSMRDSQSLLEQLLSFSKGKITVADVHRLLGTADMGLVSELAVAMLDRDSGLTLKLIHQAIQQGVDPGQFASQLLRYLRDAMMVKASCSPDTLLTCSESDLPRLAGIGKNYSLETFLAILQILDAAVVKMQSSLHSRILLEMATVRVCQLENLDSLSELLKQVSQSPSVTIHLGQRSADAPGPANLETTTANQKKKPLDKPAILPSHHLGQGSSSEPALDSTASVSAATAHQKGSTASPKPAFTADTLPGGVTPDAQELPASIESPEAGFRNSQKRAKETVDTLLDPDSDPKSGGGSSGLPRIEASDQNLRETGPEGDLVVAEAARPWMKSELQTIWKKLEETIGGVTADLLGQPESISSSGGVITVVLADDYKVRECQKPERKQKIEQTLEELTGRPARLNFRASSQSLKPNPQESPQLPRAQQMRMLQEHPLVKQAISIFDAELTNFISPPKKP